MLQAGLNPEITDTEHHSLLYQCATCVECIEVLVRHGVDLNRRSGRDGETAFMRAMFLEEVAAIRRLAKHGANPVWRPPSHIEDRLKYNAKLCNAVTDVREKWRKSQPKRKARPSPARRVNQKKNPKPTITRFLGLLKPHTWIQEGEQIEGLEELVFELGSLRGLKQGQWPDFDKIEDPHLLGLFLDAGLNPNITTKSGNSLVRQCVSHPDCIKKLVKAGAKIDQANEDGETPLMLACYKAQKDCVQALLDAGADPTREFSQFAGVLLNMNDEMRQFIEAAQAKWKRKRSRKSSRKKA